MDPVAAFTPALSPDQAPGDEMTSLSQVALGPVNTGYYLAVFERFDNTGRTPTTWNWPASLCTLSWMVFRRLWGAALAYVAAAQGLALLALGIGRYVLEWPQTVEWGVLGAFALLAFAAPGLYGNALLYADIRKRIDNALAASHTLQEARALLTQKASSQRRLQALVLLNAALAIAAVLVYMVRPSADSRPLALEPAVTVAQATAVTPATATAIAEVTAAPATAAAPVQEIATVDMPATPTAATAAAPNMPAPGPTVTPVAAVAATVAAAQPAGSQQPAAAAVKTMPLAATNTQKTTRTPAQVDGAAKRPAETSKNKIDTAPNVAHKPTPPTPAAMPKVGTAPGYYINVGIFADEANARRTQAQLLNEGLPAFRQALHGAKGRLIRVRVGPYPGRSAADTAAASVRDMHLEAVVFRQ